MLNRLACRYATPVPTALPAPPGLFAGVHRHCPARSRSRGREFDRNCGISLAQRRAVTELAGCSFLEVRHGHAQLGAPAILGSGGRVHILRCDRHCCGVDAGRSRITAGRGGGRRPHLPGMAPPDRVQRRVAADCRDFDGDDAQRPDRSCGLWASHRRGESRTTRTRRAVRAALRLTIRRVQSGLGLLGDLRRRPAARAASRPERGR